MRKAESQIKLIENNNKHLHLFCSYSPSIPGSFQIQLGFQKQILRVLTIRKETAGI
jgi:hypothetical protein